MSQDLLSQIKEAEEKAEKEIIEFDKNFKIERENKLSVLNDKISLVKKEHKERLLNLDNELEDEFKKIDKEFNINIEKEKEDLKKRANSNSDSFFNEILK